MVNKRLFFVFFVLIFYYVPVLLLWYGVIDFQYRFVVLIVLTVVLIIYSFFRDNSPFELGFRSDNLKESLAINAVWGAVIVLSLGFFYYSGIIRKAPAPSAEWFFPFYVFVSAPAQEFMYRSVLFAELRKAEISSAAAQIAITALTYCFLHIIYNDLITLAATSIMGIVWGLIYVRQNNFFGVAFSHAVLGAISIYIGLI